MPSSRGFRENQSFVRRRFGALGLTEEAILGTMKHDALEHDDIKILWKGVKIARLVQWHR
jgi:hypothetical protein